MSLPDAPWIRDAELNGYPMADSVRCPECGEECETIYVDANNTDCVYGCNKCIRSMEALDWKDIQNHDGRDDW